MRIFTNKKFRNMQVETNVTINELKTTVESYSKQLEFLEKQQDKARDMLYDLANLIKNSTVSKGTILDYTKKIIKYIEKGK